MIREKMQNIPMKRVVVLSIPYLIIFYLADKSFWLYRHCIGDSMIEKIGVMLMNFQLAFTNWLPSFHMQDLLGGVVTVLIFRLILYYKTKNAKKFRHGEEYGSARWGNRKDIEPFEDPVFENNIILTETERLTMNSRPKAPKYARNKNVIVIGGGVAGMTAAAALARKGYGVHLIEKKNELGGNVAAWDRLFPEGTLVLIDPDDEVRNGEVGVVFVNGDDATLKRVYYDGETVRLHPESYDPEYMDRVIDRRDPDAPEVRILGKAVSYTAPDGWRA